MFQSIVFHPYILGLSQWCLDHEKLLVLASKSAVKISLCCHLGDANSSVRNFTRKLNLK